MVRPRAVEEQDSGDSSEVLHHAQRNTWAPCKSVSGRYWTVSEDDAVMWLLRSDYTPLPEFSDAFENLEI
ncbi:MAG: hypothetical protein OXI46_03225 [Gemmatimonadota bacterium]|nr:hypothetical protein [Gemmatimonadota bacterium]